MTKPERPTSSLRPRTRGLTHTWLGGRGGFLVARGPRPYNRKPSHLIVNLGHKKGTPTEADAPPLQPESSS